MKLYLILVTFFFSTVGSAERILVPITGLQSDAHGRVLKSTGLWAHNLSSETIYLRPTFSCVGTACFGDTALEPGSARPISLPGVPDGLPPGRILTATRGAVPPGRVLTATGAEGLFLHLRIRDESQNASSIGVEIPLVREAELYSSALSLLNIPGDERFRHTLWIYDVANKPTEFRVRLYRQKESRMPISEQIVILTVNPHKFINPILDPQTYVPSAAQLDLRPMVPSGDGLYYVTVEPLQGASFWAFLSVSNSDTQELTIITPGGGARPQRGRVRSARR